jgi:hypothetical protein
MSSGRPRRSSQPLVNVARPITLAERWRTIKPTRGLPDDVELLLKRGGQWRRQIGNEHSRENDFGSSVTFASPTTARELHIIDAI